MATDPIYIEPWHVIIDAITELRAKINQGDKPWEGYESCFDFYGMVDGPSESEYIRAMMVAEAYATQQIE